MSKRRAESQNPESESRGPKSPCVQDDSVEFVRLLVGFEEIMEEIQIKSACTEDNIEDDGRLSAELEGVSIKLSKSLVSILKNPELSLIHDDSIESLSELIDKIEENCDPSVLKEMYIIFNADNLVRNDSKMVDLFEKFATKLEFDNYTKELLKAPPEEAIKYILQDLHNNLDEYYISMVKDDLSKILEFNPGLCNFAKEEIIVLPEDLSSQFNQVVDHILLQKNEYSDMECSGGGGAESPDL